MMSLPWTSDVKRVDAQTTTTADAAQTFSRSQWLAELERIAVLRGEAKDTRERWFMSLWSGRMEPETMPSVEKEAMSMLASVTPEMGQELLSFYESHACSSASKLQLKEWIHQTWGDAPHRSSLAADLSVCRDARATAVTWNACLSKEFGGNSSLSAINAVFLRRPYLRHSFPPSAEMQERFARLELAWRGGEAHERYHVRYIWASPAECFAVGFADASDVSRLWIKGWKYQFAHLTCELATSSVKWSLISCRLSPRHYHHIHMPVTARLVGAMWVPGAHWPVQPTLLASTQHSVWTENVRLILRWETPGIGAWWMIFVGATCTSSIVLDSDDPYIKRKAQLESLLKRAQSQPRRFCPFSNNDHSDDIPNHHTFAQYERIGYFRYGSTVLLIVPSQTPQHRKDVRFMSSAILVASKQQVETYVPLGHPIIVEATQETTSAAADADAATKRN